MRNPYVRWRLIHQRSWNFRKTDARLGEDRLLRMVVMVGQNQPPTHYDTPLLELSKVGEPLDSSVSKRSYSL